VDEVQRVPALLPAVHLLMEERRDVRFVLTGSSTRSLRRGGENLLGGRAVVETMHPFMAAELGARFGLDSALAHGLVPLVTVAKKPARVLAGYLALYVEEEVRAEGHVRRIGDFARFMEAVSFSHGAVLNLANVARECEVSRSTVEGYLDILEDMLLAFRVPAFRHRAERATTVHPKFYLFDAGVFRAARPAGPLDRPQEIDGAALEGLVAQHLRAWAAYDHDRRAGLYFWRTRAGTEVDFVVYGPSDFEAIEVKNTGVVRPEDLRGLRAFRDEHPESEAILLYRGRERLRIGDVHCVPADEFLARLRPGRPLDAAL
jgi:predicted AAA+ superfamily ATPase